MNTVPPWTAVLFDVDGTLVDSAGVVLQAFRRTIEDLDLEPRADEQLRRYVGPPLWQSFEDLGLRGEERDLAVQRYRDHYLQIYLEPDPYPGIPELLKELHARGIALATATSKQEYMARGQLEHLGLDDLFRAISGATPDLSSSKATVARDALARLAVSGADVSRPVLVGDRSWDVDGGSQIGIPVIGAGWGYGEPGELAGALVVAENVPSARALLISGSTT